MTALFSDYIAYADESGSPTLDGADPHFPVFVLAMMLVRKTAYVDDLVPKVQRLKFDFAGHDQIILHERDVRRQKGAFAFLQTNEQTRAAFLGRIENIVATSKTMSSRLSSAVLLQMNPTGDTSGLTSGRSNGNRCFSTRSAIRPVYK